MATSRFGEKTISFLNELHLAGLTKGRQTVPPDHCWTRAPEIIVVGLPVGERCFPGAFWPPKVMV